MFFEIVGAGARQRNADILCQAEVRLCECMRLSSPVFPKRGDWAEPRLGHGVVGCGVPEDIAAICGYLRFFLKKYGSLPNKWTVFLNPFVGLSEPVKVNQANEMVFGHAGRGVLLYPSSFAYAGPAKSGLSRPNPT